MNIDLENLKKQTHWNGAAYKQIESYEIKVNCDDCALLELVTEHTSGCLYCTNNPAHKNNFKPRPKEWYEDESNFPCLCWVSYTNENVSSDDGCVSLVTGCRISQDGEELSFGQKLRYATPLTKKEVLNYCVGEK